MAAYDDESEFDADTLNQLPQSTLQNLEFNALSTQRSVAARRQRQLRETTRPFHLTRPNKSPVDAPSISIPAPPLARPDAAPASPESDYGFDEDSFDENVIDLNDSTLNLQPALANTKHPAPVSNNAADPIVLDNDPPPYEAAVPTLVPHSKAHNSTALEARIKQLEAQLNTVNLTLQAAQDANQKQAGENAIIRGKQEKDTKDHESKMTALQKQHADELAKHKVDLDSANKEIENLKTNHRFLEHDLVQTTHERSKRLKSAKPGPSKLTRRSSQSLPYRDGFDDHEILVPSPSKPKDKPKPTTPKVGEKRKRNAAVSPAPQLQLNAPPSASPSSVTNIEGPAVAAEELLQINASTDLQFQMIQRLMNHRPFDSRERALETLSRLDFPSLPGQSISGIFSDALSGYIGVDKDDDFASFACNVLSDLWDRSLQDKFYTPVYLFLDLFEFVLAMSTEPPKISLIERFMPLATKTIDLIAVPRVRSSSGSGADPHLLNFINVDQILGLMQNMAFDASLSIETCQTFWQKMEFDFTLMMLNKSQPLPQIMLVLQMLGSSTMPESFGVIPETLERQAMMEVHTIDRLTTLLFERPEAPSDELPYEETEIAALQIETIRVLTNLATTKHGSEVLANHRTAIGRLVRLLHVQVTKLYDLPLTTIDFVGDALCSTGTSTIHKLTTNLINLTVRLIYHLLTNYAKLINLRDKLMVIPGGHHKFLVSLTRLAFSEQLMYEAGIEHEVVDAAHEILDMVLSPEEGEAVVHAIQTPRGTNGTRAPV